MREQGPLWALWQAQRRPHRAPRDTVFSVLSETAIVFYKCDQFYDKTSEGGIRFDDPTLNIDWGIDLKTAIISDKDLELPNFSDCNNGF